MPPKGQKALPDTSTWDSIRPPYLEYPYFQDPKLPFDNTTQSFHKGNAWWLIEASTLAYADKTTVDDHLQGAPVTKAKFFSGPSTQCYVANNKDFAWVVFRGTEIRTRNKEKSGLLAKFDIRNIIEDILADMDFLPADSEGQSDEGLLDKLKHWFSDFGGQGMVHRGFKRALEEVWEELFDYLKQQDAAGRTLWFTGHSLGAALATLAAARYGNVQGLYTFGSPMVGDADFCQNFKHSARTYRFVNNRDIITRLPPFPPFQHVGELYFIDSNGLIGGSDIIDVSPNTIWQLLAIMWEITSNIGESFIDHVPTLYATHIWNHCCPAR